MSEIAFSPVILAAHLYEEAWTGNRNDPRLDRECFVRDANLITGWWRPGPNGHTAHEAEAGTFTPRDLFARYGALNDDTYFHFLDPVPEPVVLPPPEMRVGIVDARSFLSGCPDRCFIVQGRNSRRWATRALLDGAGMSEEGAVADRNQAGIFVGLEVMLARFDQLNFYFEILPKEFKPQPPGKIRIDRILTRQMIETLKELPTSQVVRTQIWSIIKSPIPEDKKTYHEIKTWIEENYDPKPTGLFRKPSPDQPVVGADGFSVECSLTYRVHGHCSYSADEAGSDEYNVTGTMLEEAAAKAQGHNHPEEVFLAELDDALRQVVDHNEPDMEESTPDIYDREVRDRENIRINISRNLRVLGLAWLRRYHPDLAQQGEAPPPPEEPSVTPQDEPAENQ